MADKIVQLKDGNESVYPVAIKTISNSNGTALKFADGTMICMGKATVSSNFVQWDTMYSCDLSNVANFPVAFIDVPVLNVNVGGGSAQNCWIARCSATKTKIEGTTIVRPNGNNGNIVLNYIAIGRWK